MSNREDAKEFIREFCSCAPKNFFSEVEETQRGIGFILMYLSEAKDEVVAGDLAREMSVSTARIAVLLKKMEGSELIVRYASSKDARKTVVEMTTVGKKYLDKIKEEIIRKAELLLEKIGKKELQDFLQVSYRIQKILEEA